MIMKPNLEQQAIIDAFLSRSGSIAVNALAGTGKTTTLKMLAEAAPGQRMQMQYLAFNRAIADDARAKMPRNVEVGTMHSLAYRAMQPDRARLEMRLNGGYVAQRLSLTSVTVRLDFGDFLLTPAQQGAAIIATVSRFCNSGDLDLTIKHVASWQTVFEECPRALDQDQGLKQIIFKAAEKLWSDMRSRKSDCPITHDTYLKLWALAMGQIRADVLFFDEAQVFSCRSWAIRKAASSTWGTRISRSTPGGAPWTPSIESSLTSGST
jgi:superfamily I DNA/RNA helicase